MCDSFIFSLDLPDEAATDRWGQLVAAALQPGAVVALIGPLGAGKTRLVKAIARELGVPDEDVNSPTFVLIQEYAGRFPLRHCDAYRLKSPAEFRDLGLEELFASDGIALIEWADRVSDDLPDDRLEIRLTPTGLTSRRAVVTSGGAQSAAMWNQLSQHAQ